MTEAEQDTRLEQLLAVLLAIARQDFNVRAPVSDEQDVVDAIAVGLNMLVEELRGEVASRKELQRALDELRHTQAKLVHAGKLAAIGQLAAGVAHEINNPIQGVQVSLAIVQRTHQQMAAAMMNGTLYSDQAADRMERCGRAVADAQEAIERVRGVTGALRTFARVDDVFDAVQLDDVVRVSCRLSATTARVRCKLELDLPPVPLVHGNRGKLGQVVTNLLLNAIQALPEGDPDRHVIRLSLSHGDDMIRLTVDDSGPGIAVADRGRIFDPFFTTKPEDVGMGLGLTLAAEIARAHGGTIAVTESPLGGARFVITLPVMTKHDSIRPPSVPPGPPPRARVLLVDDEEMLLRLFESLLGDDCAVTTAASGGEALKILREDRSFDLIVCDLHMPRVDGVEVYETALTFAPELKKHFVFATGGAVTTRSRTFLDTVRPRVLQKPFQVSALLDLLRA